MNPKDKLILRLKIQAMRESSKLLRKSLTAMPQNPVKKGRVRLLLERFLWVTLTPRLIAWWFERRLKRSSKP